MKKIIKYILALFAYAFLLLEGFIGGGTTNSRDIWNDLEKWINKE